MEVLRSSPNFFYEGQEYSDTTSLEEVERLARSLGVFDIKQSNLETLLSKSHAILVAQGKVKAPQAVQVKVLRRRRQAPVAKETQEEAQMDPPPLIPLELGAQRGGEETLGLGYGSNGSGGVFEKLEKVETLVDGKGSTGSTYAPTPGSRLFEKRSGPYEGLIREVSPADALSKIRLALLTSVDMQVAGKFDPIVNIDPLKTAHWDPNFLALRPYPDASNTIRALMAKTGPPDDSFDASYEQDLMVAKSQVQSVFPRPLDHRRVAKLSASERVDQLALHAMNGTNLKQFCLLLRAPGTAFLNLNKPIETVTLQSGKTTSVNGQTVLMLLVSQPNFFLPNNRVLAMVEALLETPSYHASRGIDLNQTDNNGDTVLHHLVKRCAEIRQTVLKESVSNQVVGESERVSVGTLEESQNRALTLIHHLFRRILDDRSDPPIISVNKDNKGKTPLWLATHENCVHCVITLVAHSRELLDARQQDEKLGNNAVMNAVRNDNFVIVALLMRQWMAIPSANKEGQNPFHAAARMGYDKARLRSELTNEMWQDWEKAITPASAASSATTSATTSTTTYQDVWKIPDPSIFQLLLRMLTRQATAFSAFEGDGTDTTARIQRLVSDVLNQKDKEGLTPLIIASISRDRKMVQELLLAGADPNQKYGNTVYTARDLVAHLLLSPHSQEQKKDLATIEQMLNQAQGQIKRKMRNDRTSQATSTDELTKFPKLRSLLSGKDSSNKEWATTFVENVKKLAQAAKKNKDLHRILTEHFHTSHCRVLNSPASRQEHFATVNSIVDSTDRDAGKSHLDFLRSVEHIFKKAMGTLSCEEIMQALAAVYQDFYNKAS